MLNTFIQVILMKSVNIFLLLVLVITIIIITYNNKILLKSPMNTISKSIFPLPIELHMHKLYKYRYYNSKVFDHGFGLLKRYYSDTRDIMYFKSAISSFEELSFMMDVDESFLYQKLINELSCMNDHVNSVFMSHDIDHNYFD
jgi:hypothetical protein